MLLAVSQKWGLKGDHIPRVATGFGGGLGRMGSTCGALTGAVMALGLRYGRTSGAEDRQRTYGPVQKVYGRFRDEMSDVLCRQLTGMDLTAPDAFTRMRELGISERVCERAIALAARLAVEEGGK